MNKANPNIDEKIYSIVFIRSKYEYPSNPMFFIKYPFGISFIILKTNLETLVMSLKYSKLLSSSDNDGNLYFILLTQKKFTSSNVKSDRNITIKNKTNMTTKTSFIFELNNIIKI